MDYFDDLGSLTRLLKANSNRRGTSWRWVERSSGSKCTQCSMTQTVVMTIIMTNLRNHETGKVAFSHYMMTGSVWNLFASKTDASSCCKCSVGQSWRIQLLTCFRTGLLQDSPHMHTRKHPPDSKKSSLWIAYSAQNKQPVFFFLVVGAFEVFTNFGLLAADVRTGGEVIMNWP